MQLQSEPREQLEKSNQQKQDTVDTVETFDTVDASPEQKSVKKVQNVLPSKRTCKKRSVFYICYAALCGLIVIVLICGVFIFYDFIREYENSLPEYVAKEYVSTLQEPTITNLLKDELDERRSGFEAENALSSIVSQSVKEGVVFTECVGEELPTYDVYCGGKMMKVRLRVSRTGKYGFSHYEVESAEIYPEWINAKFINAVVIVPDNSTVAVNGVSVTEKYKTNAKYKSAVLSPLEKTDPTLVEYKIENIFGPVAVSGDYGGGSLSFSCIEDNGLNIYYSDFDIPGLVDYTLKVPSNAEVMFNGKMLSSELITDSVAMTSLVSEFETDRAPLMSVYTVKGLISKPEVTVTFNGETLAPLSFDNAHGEYSFPASALPDYTVKVPIGMRLFCNGIEVNPSYITESTCLYDSPYAAFAATERYNLYTIALFNSPEFTVSAANAAKSVQGYAYTFYPLPNESQDSEIRSQAELFTELFVNYSMQGGSARVEANYNKCMQHVLSKSDAYNMIRNTLSSFKFNSTYTVTKFERSVYDLAKYSDNCFSVKVDFDVFGVSGKYEKPSVGTYEMVWVKSGGNWKLAVFTV